LAIVVKPEISICVCTYRRPASLKKCLESLLAQKTDRDFEIVVVDNDREGPARETVQAFRRRAAELDISLSYFIEPERNIACARNCAVVNSNGSAIAFIDDDEYAAGDWIERLSTVLAATNSSGVFGPVLAEFPEDFPEWMKRSRLFEHPRQRSGVIAPGSWKTGNALLSRDVLLHFPGPFDPAYGRTGGEDTELFGRLYRAGCVFYWCDEATVYEVQEDRGKRLRWHWDRGYRGGWTFARQMLESKGHLRGTVIVCGRCLLGSGKTLVDSMKSLATPRLAAFIFVRGTAGQMGKIGCLLGKRPKEYGNP
jgi:succinoglycan biosynthesis protein ExoM